MMNQARQRIVQFLQLAHCHFRVEGQQIITANATLHFSEQNQCQNKTIKPGLVNQPVQRRTQAGRYSRSHHYKLLLSKLPRL